MMNDDLHHVAVRRPAVQARTQQRPCVQVEARLRESRQCVAQAGIALAGLFAFVKLPVSPLPQVDFPTILVQASLPGASPETVATSVTSPLERHLGSIADVAEMTSMSSVGNARIVLQFNLNRDIDGAARDETVVGLHPALRRADGTGVFASGVASVSIDHFDERLLPPGADAALNDEHARALLLAADVLDELLERHAVLATDGASRPAEPLRLHLLLPERWQPMAGALAAWLDTHVARERWMPGVERVQTRMVANPVQAWAVVDELIVSLHREPSNANQVVHACD